MRIALLTTAAALAFALASGCHLATDDFEQHGWYDPYGEDEEVPGTDFCYDFYALLCLKLRQCYPDSMYQELTNDECAQSHYDELCVADIYQTGVVEGAVANTCFDAVAAWSCAELDHYMQTSDLPGECQSPFAD
jgi:hypothetical protein